MTDEMQQYVCKNCNAALNVSNAVGGVVKCEYCESVFVLPKPELSEKARITLVSAENALDTCDFESAYTLFQKAMELDPTEPQSFFGAALAKHKVQYLKDTVNNRLQPICHEMTRAKFCDDKNYKTALDLATPEQKAEYEQKASEIDYIKDKFIEQDKNGVSYDCFICVKVTDGEKHTRDYDEANELYYALKDKGYKPFFSERCIKNLAGADYEAVILYALYMSESMLVVCGNEDYLETPWVKNEYTRFIELIRAKEKGENSITLACFNGMIERLPGIPYKIQAIDLNRKTALEQVYNFIDKWDPEKQAHAKKIEQERAAAQDKQKAEEIARIKAEAERKAQEAAERAAKLEEEMNRMREMLAAKEQATTAQVTPKPQDNTSAKAQAAANLATALRGFAAVKEQDTAQTKESPKSDFTIKDGVLIKYTGTGGDVVIPRGITAICDFAFQYCTSLTSVEIPDSVTSIGENAFFECPSLTSVTIPNSVTSIGDSAFCWCFSLKSVKIPDSVTSIGESAFDGCKSLTSVTIPDSVTSIGRSAFSGCESLTSVTIPDSVTSIGFAAFSGCSSLSSVTIPDSVTSIGGSAFGSCESLKSVTIPDSVTSIGAYAFCDCKSLASITVSSGNRNYHSSENCLIKTATKTLILGCKNSIIPNDGSVTSIGDGAFSGCKFTSIEIPDSVTSIGDSAFCDCRSLTSVEIPDSVKFIGICAFEGCSSLTSVTIPNSVTSIGEYAFDGCKSLTSVTIPKSDVSIGYGAFEGKDLVITCDRKETSPGVSKGFAEGWNGIARVVWKK